MHTMTTKRRPYILPEALDQVTEELTRGHNYQSALLNVAIRFNVPSFDLREVYEAKRRGEAIAQRIVYAVCAAAVVAVVLTY